MAVPPQRRNLVLVVVILVGLVGLSAFAFSRRGAYESQSPQTIDSIPFNALVMGEVIGPSSEGRFGGTLDWPVLVLSIDYDRGDYVSGSGEIRTSLPLPTVGESFEVAVSREFKIDADGTYFFYMDRAFFADPQEQSRWPWQAALVLDAKDPFAPVAGTPTALVESLEAVRLEGESAKDALIAFAQQYAAFRDAENAGENPERPSRLLAVDAWRNSGPEIVAWPADVAQRPASGRQLPGDLADVADIETAGLRSAYGVDEWIPWRVTLYLDAEVTDGNGWIAVLIDDTGFFGPYGITPRDFQLVIDGYGPPGGTLSLMTWPDDLPVEVAPTGPEGLAKATIRSLDLPRVAVPEGATEFERTSVGISVTVNLRFGGSAIVIPNN
ncbi:hypothetical protein BMS3Bbin02_01517 [bacterium BMS3Bbin02]|nr:hypothetical protein BMS3Bbin02_01517 [bacterium BMS3Bbin02]